MDLLATKELGEESRALTNINKNGAGSRDCTDCIMHVRPEKRRVAWKTHANAPDFDTNQLLSVCYLPRGLTVTQ